jgi:hypothetical protein
MGCGSAMDIYIYVYIYIPKKERKKERKKWEKVGGRKERSIRVARSEVQSSGDDDTLLPLGAPLVSLSLSGGDRRW